MNPRLCELSGYTREELIGQPATLLWRDTPDEMRERFDQIRRTGEYSDDRALYRKDGTAVPVSFSASADRTSAMTCVS